MKEKLKKPCACWDDTALVHDNYGHIKNLRLNFDFIRKREKSGVGWEVGKLLL